MGALQRFPRHSRLGPARLAFLRLPGALAIGTFAACASTLSQGQVPTAGIPPSEVPVAGSPAAGPGSDGRTSPAADAAVDSGTRDAGHHDAGHHDAVPKSGDAGSRDASAGGAVLGATSRGADSDFEAARGRFDRGEVKEAKDALEAFVATNPTHPSRISADLMLARLALGRGDPKQAERVLEPLVELPDAGATSTGVLAGQRAAGRYYLGIAEVRLGNFGRGRELLLPFLPKGAADAPPTDEAGIELRGALAEALAPTDPMAALDLWTGFFRAGRDSEKAWARKRATEVATQISLEDAWRAYGAASPSGLARAVLGAKAALYLRGRGDTSGAASLETETNGARRELGFDSVTSRVGPGDPTRIGLAIPLSGKFQVVGEAALRAAMLAGGAPVNAAPPGGAAPSQLLIRDTGADADRAARGVSELTRTEAVIGIVGASSSKVGTGAVSQASLDGIALLSLDDSAPGALTSAFQMIHPSEMRAATLAKQAIKAGARRFALLGPDHASGKKMRDAFRKAVTEAGGAVVVESTYVAGATSFAPSIAPLKKATFDAIFVPDSADRLSLLAPALAVADFWPQAWSKSVSDKVGRGPSARKGKDKDKGERRPVLLLSTANDLSQKLLEQAGRYVQGAFLCPGFFAANDEPSARGFVDAYRVAYGREPHAVEAYAYDAVAALRLLAQQGVHTRADVIRALGAKDGKSILVGLTGNLAFGPDHGRIDSPNVYVVDGSDIRIAH